MSNTTSYTSLQEHFKHHNPSDSGSTTYQPDPLETLEIDAISNAGKLGKWSFCGWALFFIDIILALLPLLFIVLAIIAASLNGKPTSHFGASVQEVITLSPTIFPIIFAALMGKFFKTWALYRAERGVLLGTLEQLVGCQSLFGAIERQITLRHSNIVGLVIVLLWALSPVGGQSALRLLSRSPHPVESNVTVRYLPVAASYDTFMDGADDVESGWPSYAPVYMAALETSQTLQNSTMDLWGNVRIPTIESISSGVLPGDGWQQVDYTNNVTYSSFLGIPIGGLPKTANSTFNITSRYWNVDCPNLYEIANYTVTNMYPWNMSRSSFILTNGNYTNTTAAGIQSFDLISMMSQPAEQQCTNGTTCYSFPITVANCTVAARDVVSSIDCVGDSCHVASMQLSTVPVNRRPSLSVVAMENLWDAFPRVTIGLLSHQAEGSIESSTPTEMWLFDPETAFQISYTFVNLSALSPQVLSSRLQLVYNTFWQTTYGTQYLVGGSIPANLSYYIDSTLMDPSIDFNTTLARVTIFDGELYLCHWRYAALLFLISLILLIAALTSLVLRAMTLAPDILGCVSTCTRDNPYVALGTLSEQPSHLNGLARARALRDLRVMIGDVNGESEVGHIAFADMRREPERLRRKRLYD